jgi:hypothetical protein
MKKKEGYNRNGILNNHCFSPSQPLEIGIWESNEYEEKAES